MNKKSQALVISSWVLVVLTVIAVSLGHRVSMELRLNRYHRDSLKALYLAKAGVTRAIAELSLDTSNSYDALNESWADNEVAFKEIRLHTDGNELFNVSYYSEADEIKYGVKDEESKIDINLAGENLLVALFTESGINAEKASELAKDVRIWNGTAPTPADYTYYDTLGYPCKNAPLNNIEELILIKGVEEVDANTLGKIKSLITVHGGSAVNINTASQEALTICALSATDPTMQDSARALANSIISLRQTGQTFDNLNNAAIKTALGIAPADPQGIIIDTLITSGLLSITSSNFTIEATGNSSSVSKKITAIYNREPNKKIVFWHEN